MQFVRRLKKWGKTEEIKFNGVVTVYEVGHKKVKKVKIK